MNEKVIQKMGKQADEKTSKNDNIESKANGRASVFIATSVYTGILWSGHRERHAGHLTGSGTPQRRGHWWSGSGGVTLVVRRRREEG